jgi:hypothetical protein
MGTRQREVSVEPGREVFHLLPGDGRADEDAAERVSDEGDSDGEGRVVAQVGQDLLHQTVGHRLQAGKGVALKKR